jgi:diaminopimelate epimerase
MDAIKAHGTGNDFVVFADLADRLELSADLVRALTDRRTGVGGDGVIRLGGPPTDQPDADVMMDYRNADGSIVEMCGNGVRVAAKLAVDHGMVTPDGDEVVRVATRAGTKAVTVHRDGEGRVAEVTVAMGAPIVTPDDVPFQLDGADPATVTHHLDVDGEVVRIGVVSMGNPHAVTLVDDVVTAPVRTLGPRIETHRRFPAKVNAGFAQVVDRGAIRLRVWERGVGETAACGTGACAAVVALQRQGLVDDTVAVHLPGGRLTVVYPVPSSGGDGGGHLPASGDGPLDPTTADAATVTMRGPAVEVAHLELADAWLTAVGAPTSVAPSVAQSVAQMEDSP